MSHLAWELLGILQEELEKVGSSVPVAMHNHSEKYSKIDYKVKISVFGISTAMINVLSPVFYCILSPSQLDVMTVST